MRSGLDRVRIEGQVQALDQAQRRARRTDNRDSGLVGRFHGRPNEGRKSRRYHTD